MRWATLIFILFLAGCATEVAEEAPLDFEFEQEVIGMKLTSPAFSHNGMIPAKYTCQGSDVNPELNIENIPDGTKSLVLIMDDPDAPMGTWDHWIVFNIGLVDSVAEDSVPDGAVQGVNSWGRNNYGGPCPPSGTHKYVFKLYALDTTLEISQESTKREVESAMQGHVLEQATLIGLYQKS